MIKVILVIVVHIWSCLLSLCRIDNPVYIDFQSLVINYNASLPSHKGQVPAASSVLGISASLYTASLYFCLQIPWKSTMHILIELRFFLWTIFKVFIKFSTVLFLFYILVFWPQGMWDLGSPARDWTCTPCIGRWSLNHQTAREVSYPYTLYMVFIHRMYTYTYICMYIKTCI